MLSALVHLLVRSWGAMIAASSTSTFGFFCWMFGGAIAIGVAQVSYSWFAATRNNEATGLIAAIERTWKSFLVELGALIILTILVWGVFVWRTVYYVHTGLKYEIVLARQQNQKSGESDNLQIREIRSELESRKHVLRNTDPSFQNMTNTIRAFMTWRRNIGYDSPCKILVTSPDGDDNMYMTFITMAVFGSNCSNGDLNNVGVKRENIEDETKKGMVPGIIVFHAPADAAGANQLENELSNLFQVKRAFTIPGDAQPNTIWLQFGTGVKFNSERFAAQ